MIPVFTAALGGAVAIASSGCGGASRPHDGARPSLAPRDDLAAVLRSRGFDGAFVAWEAGATRGVCVGGARCRQRFAPASTFKVPNALIGLELGALSGPADRKTWDGQTRWVAAWNRDHTLATAIRDSVVWYFQELARQVGRADMQRMLDALDYGNRRIGGAVDAFWLDNSLRISPAEQVRFWHRLHAGTLPAGAATRADVLAMTELARDRAGVFRGKTGWYRRRGQTDHGWFTGCVDGATRVCFATVLFAREPFDHREFRRARIDLTRALLTRLGYRVP